MLLVWLLLDRRWRRQVLCITAVIALGFGLLMAVSPGFQNRVESITDPQHSANTERILMWHSAMEITRDYPVFGVGQDQFVRVYNTEYISPLARERTQDGNPLHGLGHPHNNVLKTASEGGALGLLAFFMLYGYLLYRLYKGYKAEQNGSGLSSALMGILVWVALQAAGLTDTNITQVPIMREFWLLMMIKVRNNLASAYNRILKRIFDIVVSLVGLLVALPLGGLLAIAIYVDSPGPVVFAHRRVGRGGKEFPCYKFRTMVPNAETILRDYLIEHPEANQEWQRDFKLKEDPRITRIGAFLRRTSLDELPQLINVLKGEMSLVGPRPIVRAEIVKYGEYIHGGIGHEHRNHQGTGGRAAVQSSLGKSVGALCAHHL